MTMILHRGCRRPRLLVLLFFLFRGAPSTSLRTAKRFDDGDDQHDPHDTRRRRSNSSSESSEVVRDASAFVAETLKRALTKNELSKDATRRWVAAFGPTTTIPRVRNATTPTRACGEVISRMTAGDVRRVLYQLLYIVFNEDSLGGTAARAFVDAHFVHGVETRKICSSCAEFHDAHGNVADADAPEKFEHYCGTNRFAHNITVSGIVQLPLNEDGSYLKGSLKGSVYNHWSTNKAFQCPSEMYPSDTDWGDIAQEMLDANLSIEPVAIGSVSVGSVGILADFVGYGEAWEYYKCPTLKQQYQAGIVPIVLRAREIVPEITGDETRLSGTLVNSGFSEGALAAISTSQALANLGFRVARTQVGGAPYETLTKKGVLGNYVSGIKDRKKFMPMWASAYSSTNPDVANSDVGQNVLNDEWRDTVLRWLRLFDDGDDYDTGELAEVIGDTDIHDFVNKEFDEMVQNAFADPSLTFPCDLAETGKTDLICEALAENDLRYLVVRTRQDMTYCTSTHDDWFPNYPPRLQTLFNPRLRLIRVPFLDHVLSGAFCNTLFWLYFTTPFYRALE